MLKSGDSGRRPDSRVMFGEATERFPPMEGIAPSMPVHSAAFLERDQRRSPETPLRERGRAATTHASLQTTGPPLEGSGPAETKILLNYFRLRNIKANPPRPNSAKVLGSGTRVPGMEMLSTPTQAGLPPHVSITLKV